MCPNTSKPPTVLSRYQAIQEFSFAVSRSLSQIALCEHVGSGFLIFFAIVVVAPWSALGAIIGAVSGTLSGMYFSRLDKQQWQRGFSGVNPAILGILWGGVLSQGNAKSALFVFALLACIAFERPVRMLALRWKVPVLAMPALLVGWASSLTFQIFDDSLWLEFASMPFGFWGGAASVLLVAAAILYRDPKAALVTAVYTGFVAIVSGFALNSGLIGPAGLWAFSVAPAVFGVCLMMPSSRIQLWFVLFGSAVSAVVLWFAWDSAIPSGWVPPLMFPLIAAIWGAHFAVRSIAGELATHLLISKAVSALMMARANKRKIVVLTGAGISMPSGIPDYVSATWLDPDIPVEEYNFNRFMTSRAARTAYWNSCDRFRKLAEEASPNSAHEALRDLEKGNWISGVITQNVDGLHRLKDTVELHGNIFSVRCVSCGTMSPWPQSGAWLDDELLCGECGGYQKPAVIAMGEDLDTDAWDHAKKMVEGCGVLLVIATRMTISSASALLAEARRADAQIIFITKGDIYQTVLEDDVVLTHSAEETIPTISRLLGY